MKKVIVMGAGPAGLSLAYLLSKENINTYVVEKEDAVGGISKTINYKNYYFDIGGHRFFTRFKEVDDLWHEILADKFRRTRRLSRIYYNNKFFNYPLTAVNALMGIGIIKTVLFILSYIKARLFPFKNPETFEQWVTNQFGYLLYRTFFKTYTEKVWGITCTVLQAEWAAQRIKGLSLSKAIHHAIFKPKKSKIKTLIDEFNYPVLGPGMMYNEMKSKSEKLGARVLLKSYVSKINHENMLVKSVEYVDVSGNTNIIEGTDFVSSIPITELIEKLDPKPNNEVLSASSKLCYRSIVTVDIIVNKKDIFPDNWIYIHSKEVMLGRIQNYKNWSKDMVKDQEKSSLGLEYFCNEGDDFWEMSDSDIFKLASYEIEKIKICKKSDIEDYFIVRAPKAYPVYFKDYAKYLNIIKGYVKGFNNLQLIGRYGMYKYNNMDHSILTGLYAAKNIIEGNNKYNIWDANIDSEYNEEVAKE